MTAWRFWNRSNRSNNNKRKASKKAGRASAMASTPVMSLADRWRLEKMFEPGMEQLEDRQLMAAQIFTVTTLVDEQLQSGVTTAAAATADGAGLSLREAIALANANPNGGGVDEIRFDIGLDPSEVQTIVIDGAFGTLQITDQVIIDGFTQAGASANTLDIGSDAVYRIELDGQNLTGTNSALLQVEGNGAGGTVIQGLAIGNLQSSQSAIYLHDTTGVVIKGNYIGVDATGMSNAAMGRNGILIDGGFMNTIGGNDVADRNLIAGNYASGESNRAMIYTSNSSANAIVGNYLGTDATGNQRLVLAGSNPREVGVLLTGDATDNTSIRGNVIATQFLGIRSMSGGINGTHIIENSIGVGADGTTAMNIEGSSTESGIYMDSRGSVTIQGNVIGNTTSVSHSNNYGVRINSGTAPALIADNVFVNNRNYGVYLAGSSHSNVTIAGNTFTENGSGVYLDASPSGIQIVDNSFIGNTTSGVYFGSASNVRNTTVSGNTFTGNNYGIWLNSASMSGVVIENNFLANSTKEHVRAVDGITTGLALRDNTSTGTGDWAQLLGLFIDATDHAYLSFALSPWLGLASLPASMTIFADGNEIYELDLDSSYVPGGVYTIDLGLWDEVGGGLLSPFSTITGEATDVGNNETDMGGSLWVRRVNVEEGVNPADDFDGVIIVTNDSVDDPTVQGSLAWAITVSNSLEGRQAIYFAIGEDKFIYGDAVTLNVNRGFDITDAVYIDGYSALTAITNGSSQGSDAEMAVQIVMADGGQPFIFRINGAASSGSVIRGFAFNMQVASSGAAAVYITGSSGNVVSGNYFNLGFDGLIVEETAAHAIRISGSATDNTIGGLANADTNVFGGAYTVHDRTSLQIEGARNVVIGNLLGTDRTGGARSISSGSGQLIYGIRIEGTGAVDNTVGGLTDDSRNVISGYTQDGMYIRSGATGTVIVGNYIGTDVTGNADLGSNRNGITLITGYNTVGGLSEEARNVISGNNQIGIWLVNGASNNLIVGNYIGTDRYGTSEIGNSIGIRLSTTDTGQNAVQGNTIGGSVAGSANVIAGNDVFGVQFSTNASANIVAGNWIGSDATGTKALANGRYQVYFDGSNQSSNTVGGPSAEYGNFIGGSPGSSSGVGIIAGNDNQVLWNSIGLLPNGDKNSIGGYGVYVGAGTGNTVRYNVIANASLGAIRLNGESGNDAGDADSGVNRLQNYPVITSADVNSDGEVVITFTIDSDLANATYPIEVDFYRSAAGNAVAFLGTTTVSGPGTHTITLGNLEDFPSLTLGAGITANATDGEGNSSAMSAATYLKTPDIQNVFVVTNNSSSTGTVGSLAWAAGQANSSAGYDLIAFDIASGSTVITSSGITTFTDKVYINGYSQWGTQANTLIDGSDAVLQIEVVRTGGGSTFYINSSGANDSTVRGMIFRNLSTTSSDTAALKVENVTGVTVAGNFFNTDSLGMTSTTTQTIGLSLKNADFATVGGVTAADRNVFGGDYTGTSASDVSMIGIYNGSSDNVIMGNRVGVSADGSAMINIGSGTGTLVYGIYARTSDYRNQIVNNLVSTDSSMAIRTGSSGGLIAGNTIGFAADGSAFATTNNYGISVLSGANRTTIGGSTEAERNYVAGANSAGMIVASSGNLIQGNHVGIGMDGVSGTGGLGRGISISGTDNTVGGLLAGQGNVIGGNAQEGIRLDSGASRTLVAGNLVGVGVDGLTSVSNSYGIRIYSSDNTIGGSVEGARNVFSGNEGVGIYGYGAISGNLIAGNFVGVGADGVTKVGNVAQGIQLSGQSGTTGSYIINNTIGALGEYGRNVVAGNGANGIMLQNNASGNWIINNWVGVANDGTTVYGNGNTGNSSIIIYNGDGSYNTVGGPTAEYGNVVVGVAGTSVANAIYFNGSHNLAQYNTVGIAPDGSAHGVSSAGVYINSGSGNSILYNSMANNASGINLAGASDKTDTPVISSVILLPNGELQIRFAADPDWDYSAGDLTMQFFISTGGQGTTFIAESVVDGTGYYTVKIANPDALGIEEGTTIVMTATDAEGDTSAFSAESSVIEIKVELPEDISNVYLVTNTNNDSNAGSLRWAVNMANSSAGYDAILFMLDASDAGNVTANGAFQFVATSSFTFTDQVYINGYSQFDPDDADYQSIPNTATDGGSDAKITLAVSAPTEVFKFAAGSDGSELRGFSISTTGSTTSSGAIRVDASSGIVIAGNYIGLAADGETVLDIAGHGISVSATASHVTIGGVEAADRNVITGNYLTGGRAHISIFGSENVVAGNVVGLNASATAIRTTTSATGSLIDGIMVQGGAAHDNTIGGDVVGARNIVSGATRDGIYFYGESSGDAVGNVAMGNYIGTDKTGLVDLGNARNGMTLNTAHHSILSGNLISGNDNYGVWFINSVSANLLVGNSIGVDATGNAALQNNKDGIYQQSTGAYDNTIGGSTEAARNVIAGNGERAIQFTTAATGNLISGNYIGVGANGSTLIPNGTGRNGIVLNSSSNFNTVGGPSAEYGNFIVGAGDRGVYLNGSNNLISYNTIGTLPDGSNGANSVGVYITGSGSSGNSILYNSIANNSSMGIDLAGGANSSEPAPAITGAFIDGAGDLYVTYKVTSADLLMQFFESLAGENQGMTFLDEGIASGSGFRTIKLGNAAALGITAGDSIVATQTDADGNTSEFSAASVVFVTPTVLPDDIVTVFVVTNSNLSGTGSFVQALADAKSSSGYDAILFNILEDLNNNGDFSDDVHVIGGSGANQFKVESQVFIDGYSQLGSQVNTAATGSNAQLRISIARYDSGSTFQIETSGNDSTIRGLIFEQNGQGNIDYGAVKIMDNVTGITFAGNFINTNSDATAGTETEASGLVLYGADNNTIGGLELADRNVFGGDYTNATNGGVALLYMSQSANGNTILNNLIGVGGDGESSLFTDATVGVYGVHASSTGNNSGNVIDGNVITIDGGNAIYVQNSNTTIVNNLIGVQADGTGLTVGRNEVGISITGASSNNTIGGVGMGNIIAGATNNNIVLNGTSNLVQGNYIGSDATGMVSLAGGRGIYVTGAGNTIGGDAAGSGNLVVGSNTDGIFLGKSASLSWIAGNYIGVGSDGATALGNGDAGIEVQSRDNTIGGSTSGAGNLIGGNTDGIYVTNGQDAVGNWIAGNTIGFGVGGALMANSQSGIELRGNGNTVGGTTAGSGNYISGNTGDGIYLPTSATGNIIAGNYIGVGTGSDTGMGNSGAGVFNYGVDNTIGGDVQGAGNYIGGNTKEGVYLVAGGGINSGNVVAGNTIGLGVDGTTLIGNTREGIKLSRSATGPMTYGNTIGALGDYGANVVIGNEYGGLNIERSTGNVVINNFFGTTPDGSVIAGNGTTGRSQVIIGNSSGYEAYSNTFGGATSGYGNYVASDGLHNSNGIYVVGDDNYIGFNTVGIGPDGSDAGNRVAGLSISSGTGNTILSNSFAYNDGGAITFGAGVNNDQTAPVIESAYLDSTGDLYVRFTATAGWQYDAIIELFRSEGGQGMDLLKNVVVSADGTYTVRVAGANQLGIVEGSQILATATDSEGDSSRYSSAVTVELVDANLPDDVVNVYFVTNTSDDVGTVGSLAWAIDQANNSAGYDAVLFDLPTSDPNYDGSAWVFNLTSTLVITDQVYLDGYSQLNSEANTATDGSSNAIVTIQIVSSANSALTISGTGASGSEIRGLSVGSSGSGSTYGVIRIQGSSGNVIAGNFVGLAADGVTKLNVGGNGIYVDDTSNDNIIGGTELADRNVIGGNYLSGGVAGLYLDGDRNVVEGNLIGTDRTGAASSMSRSATGSLVYGILIDGGSENNTIGGTVEGSRNVISGALQDGMYIRGEHNLVAGNYVGTSADGMSKVKNNRNGISVLVGNNTIGGDTEDYRNVISGNNSNGVWLVVAADNNVVANNYIGLNATGVSALNNGGYGVLFSRTTGGEHAHDNLVTQNVISGNSKEGVYFAGNASGNVVTDNWIGTNAAGDAVVRNGGTTYNAVGFSSSTSTNIDNEISNNVIVGSTKYGINVSGDRTQILGNTIGVLPNGTAGGNTLGAVYVNSGTGVTVRYNIMANNGGTSAILLNGGTVNDDGDADTGVNNLQNYPEVLATSYLDQNGRLYVQYTVTSVAPNSTYNMVVDFYMGTGGQGSVLLAHSIVVTGPGTYQFVLDDADDLGVVAGSTIYAIATDADGNTSEFSPESTVAALDAPANLQNVYVVTNTLDDVNAAGSLRWAIELANANNGMDMILFQIEGSGHTMSAEGSYLIQTASPLNITDEIYIDGYSQAGSIINTATDGSSNAFMMIEVRGMATGSNSTFRLTSGSSGSTLKGLAISTAGDADAAAVWINNSSGNVLSGNFFGLAGDGTTVRDMGGHGIFIESNASNNTIGGLDVADRNVFGGNFASDAGATASNSLSRSHMWIKGSANVIAGNLIGTDKTGTISATSAGRSGQNVYGLIAYGGSADRNTIGGSVEAARNVISGNPLEGIYLTGNELNVVQGNYIGLDRTGMSALGNGRHGVFVTNSYRNTIGGYTDETRNVIANNGGAGIQFSTGSSGNLVVGNFVGVAADGVTDRGNTGSGIVLDAVSRNTIGGTVAGAVNVISGNSSSGMYITNSSSLNVVLGNYIGLGADGVTDVGNDSSGITVVSSHQNTFGGSVQGAGNVIGGNSNGMNFSGTYSGNWVAGNYIGVGADGVTDVANSGVGINLDGNSYDNTIGGDGEYGRNIVVGNGANGIFLRATSTGNLINNNWVGVAADGETVRGNGTASNSSILIYGDSDYNTVSGNVVVGVMGSSANHGVYVDGFNNVVENNTIGITPMGTDAGVSGNGVYVESGGTGNVIRHNSIGNNGSIGINLVGTANSSILPPELAALTYINESGQLVIQFNTTTSTGVIDFYIAENGNGRTFVLSYDVTSAGTHTLLVDDPASLGLTEGVELVATITDPKPDIDGGTYGNTSEFTTTSTIVDLEIPDGIQNVYIVTNTADSGAGSLRAAITAANTTIGYDMIVFAIGGTGPHTITLTSALPDIIDQVYIDGFSQPGSPTAQSAVGNYDEFQIIVQSASGSKFPLFTLTAGMISTTATTSAGSTIRGLVMRSLSTGTGDSNTMGMVTIYSDNNVVESNRFGTSANGQTASGNNNINAVYIAAASGNVIDGNVVGRLGANDATSAFRFSGASATLIVGNYLGTDSMGSTRLGLNGSAIYIESNSNNNTIGGVSAATGALVGDGNLIASSYSGMQIIGSHNNVIYGNRIGVSADGTTVIGQGNASEQKGIFLTSDSKDNTVGGLGDYGNVIVGMQNGAGIRINGNGSTGNQIVGNYVGVNPNDLDDATWANNGYGIVVESSNRGNSLLNNSIAYNTLGGIQMGSSANEGQAAPVIAAVEVDTVNNTVGVSMTIANGGANTRVQLFLSQAGQGIVYLGEGYVTGDGTLQSLVITSAVPLVSGDEIVAIATRQSGSSSAFSNSERANRLPTIDGVTDLTEIDDNQTATPFSGVVIGESDGEDVTVTITLSDNANGTLDVGSTGFVWDSGSGTYIYNGSAAAATAAINALVFVPTENQALPNQTVSTTFAISVDDGSGINVINSDTVVDVFSVEDVPEINGVSGIPGSINDNGTFKPFDGVTVVDNDFDATLTVTIELNDNANGTLSGPYFVLNTSTGLYEYTGTPAEVSAALQSLVFTPTENQVTPGQTVTTIFTLSVDDGYAAPVVDSSVSVDVLSINDTPVISDLTGTQEILDYESVSPFANVTITDPDVQDMSVQVTLNNAANGQLVGGGFVETSPGSGIYVFTGSAAAAQAALRALVFVPVENQLPAGETATTEFALEISDGLVSTSDTSTTIEAYSYNDSPVMTGIPSTTITYNSSSGWVQLTQGSTVTVNDPDVSPFAGGRLEIGYLGASNQFDNVLLQLGGSNFSVSVGDLFYGGVKIGTVLSSGGAGSNLIIEFTAAATNEHVSALLGLIGYMNTDPMFESSFQRDLMITLVDGGGSAFGAINNTSSEINLVMPPTPVPPPLIPLPDGALPQLDMTPGGGPGLDNSFTRIGSFLYLNPVGSQAIASTNILTNFGPTEREMMLSQFLGDANPAEVRMERLYTNGWTDFNSFQVATQALLRQELFRGSLDESSQRMVADRIARLVTDGIFDGLSDSDISARIMSDFNDVRRQFNLEFELDEGAVQEFIRQARRIFLEQMGLHGNRTAPQTTPSTIDAAPAVEEVKAEEMPGSEPTSTSSLLGPASDGLTSNVSVTEGWLWQSGSAEVALDSLFSSAGDAELALAAHSTEVEMAEIASVSLEDSIEAKLAEETPAVPAAMGVMGMVAMHQQDRQSQRHDRQEDTAKRPPRFLTRLRKLFGLGGEK